MKTYNEIKNSLNIQIPKHLNDDFAALTHFWQSNNSSVGQVFEAPAKEYFSKITDNQQQEFVAPTKYDVPFPPPSNPRFTFIDLFAGIGGMRIAYQNLGGKCVFSSEWDKFAKQTYEANFGEVPFGDITKIAETEIPDHDVLIAGFPCQPFSIAGVSKKNALGKQHGFLDKTQGTLFFDIARILKHKKPPAFMLENVKNLLTHDKKNTIRVIKETLDNQLNYSLHIRVLDGKYYVPQHRERIIIVGFNREVFNEQEKFLFPSDGIVSSSVQDILEQKPSEKYTLSDKLWSYLKEYAKKHKAKGNGFGYGLVNLEGISRTLSARYYKDGSEILIPQKDKNPRRLTPRECARLQGYEDSFQIPVSDNQAYKQFGNSVVIPLMQDVGKGIIQELNHKHENPASKSD